MKVILVPGFWLDASSWGDIPEALRAAGHDPLPVTRVGMESRDADRSAVTMQDDVDQIVGLVDAADEPVVLVGHSGGGNVIWGAADARPDRVARLIFVDSGPQADGAIVNDGFPAVGGEIPLPDWDAFGDDELEGLDDELRADFRTRSIPEPEHVAIDPLKLSDVRRRSIPTTIVTSTFPSEKMRAMVAERHPWVAEIAEMPDVEIVDVPTGHWPQLSKPRELAAALVAALK